MLKHKICLQISQGLPKVLQSFGFKPSGPKLEGAAKSLAKNDSAEAWVPPHEERGREVDSFRVQGLGFRV